MTHNFANTLLKLKSLRDQINEIVQEFEKQGPCRLWVYDGSIWCSTHHKIGQVDDGNWVCPDRIATYDHPAP